MGDEKHYTLQIKGTAYKFTPIPSADLERIGMVFHLAVSNAKILKMITNTLKASAGDEQWDKLTDRWVAGELTTEEMTSGILNRLIARQSKDAAPDNDAS